MKIEKVVIPDEAYELWTLVHHVERYFLKAREHELRPLGISTMQAAILVIVNADNKPTPIGEIARLLVREPHTISEAIARMEKLKLVKRVKPKGKKTTIGVTVAEKGQEVLAQLSQIYYNGDVTNQIVSVLSDEERQFLRSVLEKLLTQAFDLSEPKLEWPISFRRS